MVRLEEGEMAKERLEKLQKVVWLGFRNMTFGRFGAQQQRRLDPEMSFHALVEPRIPCMVALCPTLHRCAT